MNPFSWFKKHQPTVAISFDEDNARFVALEKTDQGIQVVNHGTLPRAELAATLLQHEYTTINVVIPDHEAMMFHTHVSKEKPKHMDAVIADHIKTYCQANGLLAYAEYICEYEVILETEYGYDIHVTLVPKLYVARLRDLFKKSGIAIRFIETAHHAVARSCMHIPAGTGYVAVSFGKTKTHVAHIHADHLISQEIIPVGIETLVTTIMKGLHISADEASAILKKYGVLKTHPDNRILSNLMQALAPVVYSIDQQLVEHGKREYKIFGHRCITETMVVYGEGVEVKGLISLLGAETRLTAQALNVWSGHEQDRAPILTIPASALPAYAEAISLGLLSM